MTTRWRAVTAVTAVAAELNRRTVLTGDEVDRICREANILKAGERRTKPLDPDEQYVVLDDGTQISMRVWADAIAANAHNVSRQGRLC